eukprot:TRINITY_DN11489_c0_g1_i1.p2 TRINITY_DN11489_c0_g1~~TRINITY_DN11489_c0_g1_i1.p2  ORF type:complete len:100 (-),score=15.75 TRINITY_DN11489_c0_g1_i1:195-494(-)
MMPAFIWVAPPSCETRTESSKETVHCSSLTMSESRPRCLTSVAVGFFFLVMVGSNHLLSPPFVRICNEVKSTLHQPKSSLNPTQPSQVLSLTFETLAHL